MRYSIAAVTYVIGLLAGGCGATTPTLPTSDLVDYFQQSNSVSSSGSGIGVSRRATNTPEGGVSSKDASKKSKLDQPRDLQTLLFSPKHVKEIERIKKNKKKNKKLLDECEGGSVLEDFIANHIPNLEYCNNPLMVKKTHHPSFRKDCNAAMKKLECEDLINCGDEIKELCFLLVVLHFATEAEAEIEAGEDKLSKMKYGVGSSCIDFALDYLWSSTIRELLMSKFGMSEDAARKFWEDNKQLFIDSIAIIDHRLFISKDKDQFTQEVSDLVDKDNTNKTVLDIIGVMNGAYHNLYYYLQNDEKLRNIIFSTHVWKCNYQYVDTEREDMIAHLVGFLSHPETWVGGYMQNAANYPLELLEYFDKVISRGGVDLVKYAFGSARDKLVAKSSGDELDEGESQLLSCIENLLGEMEKGELYVGTSAVRFGSGKLTPAEREALRELLLAMRVEAGITCGSMRTLVKEIMLGLLKRKDIDTEEEALEELPGILKKLINRYYKVGDLEEELSNFEENIYNNEFKTYIDRAKKSKPDLNHIDKFVGKLKSLYNGSAKSGLMEILAGKLFGSGGLDSGCETSQITTKLEELKSRMKVESSASDDILVTFTKLLKFAPDYANELGTLAEMLQNMHMGSKLGGETAGLMQTFASEMVKHYLSTKPNVLDDIDTITQVVEELNQQYKSTLDSETGNLKSDSIGSNTVQQAFLALLSHKQDIDIPSLASLVHYHALNNEATFDRNFSLLEKYIKRKFHKSGLLPDGCTVFVYSRDDDGNRDNLTGWWSDVIGYSTHCKSAPSYKKASNEQMKRLKSIGVTDDFTAIDAAIEQAKHDKAQGKMGSAVASMKQSSVTTLDNLPIGRVGGRGPSGRAVRGRGRAVRGRVPPGRGRGGGGRSDMV